MKCPVCKDVTLLMSELDKIIARASGEQKQHASKDHDKSHKKKKSSTLLDILEIFGGE